MIEDFPRGDVLSRRTEGVGRLKTGSQTGGQFSPFGCCMAAALPTQKASVRSKCRRKKTAMLSGADAAVISEF